MTDSNRWEDRTNRQKSGNGAFDRELNTALANFAAEPRAGLEERVLANLWIEQAHAPERSWWRWPAAATLAALIVVAVSVAWRSWKPAQNIAAQHPPVTTQTNEHQGPQAANNSGSGLIRPREAASARKLKPHAVSHAGAVVINAPKLDEFPSPQPLSEQETILTRYVANYPDHAALIAQARTDELRRDSAEEDEATSAGSENSERQNK